MTTKHELVLLGGGHAHVEVLRRWARAPLTGASVTLVADRPRAVYSGMVPGFVAGQYERGELEIDVEALARRAGARTVHAAAVGVEPSRRRVLLDGRAPLGYDTVSFDVGSTTAGGDLPGVAEHALATRPIGSFVRRVDELLAGVRGDRSGPRLVVVGGGAGGVELAFCLEARLARERAAGASVTLLEAAPRILAGAPGGVVRRIAAHAARRRIGLRTGARVAAVRRGSVVLVDAPAVPCDAVVWVAGAVGLPLFRGTGLATDERGFVRVRPTLQAAGRDDVFAAGDCARFEPPLPKAGVYPVRQGPVLAANLRARVAGRPLRRYRPQRDFLSLLNLGDGRAVGSKWGLSFEGRWVFRLKDRIDRRFVRRYRAG